MRSVVRGINESMAHHAVRYDGSGNKMQWARGVEILAAPHSSSTSHRSFNPRSPRLTAATKPASFRTFLSLIHS